MNTTLLTTSPKILSRCKKTTTNRLKISRIKFLFRFQRHLSKKKPSNKSNHPLPPPLFDLVQFYRGVNWPLSTPLLTHSLFRFEFDRLAVLPAIDRRYIRMEQTDCIEESVYIHNNRRQLCTRRIKRVFPLSSRFPRGRVPT